MWRELLPAASSRAYHTEPPWLQALLPVSNSMTTKHFRNHPGGFISSAGAHMLCAGFLPEKVMLWALWPQASWPVWTEKVHRSFLLHKQKASLQHIKLLCEELTTLGGFSRYRYWLLRLLLSGSQTQPDKQLRVQPICSDLEVIVTAQWNTTAPLIKRESFNPSKWQITLSKVAEFSYGQQTELCTEPVYQNT